MRGKGRAQLSCQIRDQRSRGSGAGRLALTDWTIPGLLGLSVLASAPAMAQRQAAPEPSNSAILVDYYEPRNPEFLTFYAKMKQRGVLQGLAQFLAPVQWPKTLRVMMKECRAAGLPTPEVFYDATEYSLSICYQWFKFLQTFHPPASFATRQQVIVGGLLGIVLHEAALAVFDMLRVSRFGSEEDAADQLATYVGLQFGKETASTIVKGTYYVWDTYDYYIRTNNKQYNFAERSSVPPQRAYNTLCIAYGGDPVSFKELVEKGLLDRGLPAERAVNCADEYQQAARAFEKTIKPHVNPQLMQRVLNTAWLHPEDLQ
jgi:Putative metallopeptidase